MVVWPLVQLAAAFRDGRMTKSETARMLTQRLLNTRHLRFPTGVSFNGALSTEPSVDQQDGRQQLSVSDVHWKKDSLVACWVATLFVSC